MQMSDMHSRNGLKKIHANFPEIQRDLGTAFSRYRDNEKVVGGIIGIWARMSVDAVLRDRLEDGGQ